MIGGHYHAARRRLVVEEVLEQAYFLVFEYKHLQHLPVDQLPFQLRLRQHPIADADLFDRHQATLGMHQRARDEAAADRQSRSAINRVCFTHLQRSLNQ